MRIVFADGFLKIFHSAQNLKEHFYDKNYNRRTLNLKTAQINEP